MSDAPNKDGRITISVKREWCKSCNICVELCPRDVLSMVDKYPVATNLEECNACALCELRCPDLAIYVQTARSKKEDVA